MDYKYYGVFKRAQTAAMQLLIDLNVNVLPVDIPALLDKLHIATCTYKQGEGLIQSIGAENLCDNSRAFTVYRGDGSFIIFYDDDLSPAQLRTALAHELGHLVLGHKVYGHKNAVSKQEYEADRFAQRLLAPACVLHELGVISTIDIAALCDIPIEDAKKRAKRMRILEQRNQYYTTELERTLKKQFDGFIKRNINWGKDR